MKKVERTKVVRYPTNESIGGGLYIERYVELVEGFEGEEPLSDAKLGW
jgi:hypothetical protein